MFKKGCEDLDCLRTINTNTPNFAVKLFFRIRGIRIVAGSNKSAGGIRVKGSSNKLNPY